MQLDRSSPMPLWAQLESALRVRLASGEFDDRFPTDSELVADYHVSRHTVREAIRHLNSTGILRRERGRGTVVTQAFDQPLGALYSLFDSIESSGAEQRSEVVALREERDPFVADQLELDRESRLVYLERVRHAGDEPLALDRAWLPLALAEPLLDCDFAHTALYEQLDSKCGIRPNSGWERIAPIIPGGRERGLLQMRHGEAAFFLERLSTADGRPVEWRTTTIRGDRYRFVSRFEVGVAPALIASASR